MIPSTRLDNVLEQFIELRKMLYLLLQVCYKKHNSGTAKCKRLIEQGRGQGRTELPRPLQACHPLSMSMCSPTWTRSRSYFFKSFYTPVSSASLSERRQLKAQLSDHMVGSSGDQLHYESI